MRKRTREFVFSFSWSELSCYRIVRMSSWRDKITISGEWVSSKFDNNMIVRFIEDVAQIMLSILDSVELESSGEQIPGVHAWIVE